MNTSMRDREPLCTLAGLTSLALAALACATAPPPPAASTATQPSPPPAAAPDETLELRAIDRFRLDYVLHAIEPLSKRWPWITTEHTCVLLISLEVQWVLHCDSPPSSDFRSIGSEFRGKPVYARAATELMVEGQNIPTAEFVRLVPATASVPNPKQTQADIARETPYVLVSSLDTLIGTHPAFPETTTSEEWMSIFVHEFFQTRQQLTPTFAERLREIHEGNLDRHRLIHLYNQDPHYRSLIQKEYNLLSEAARQPAAGQNAAKQTLSNWRAVYDARVDYLQQRADGAVLIKADQVFSYLEGVARYVENIFLIDPAFHPTAAENPDPRFTSFRSFEGKGYDGMLNRGLDERYFYALGMYLALLLDRVAEDWTKRVHEHPQFLIGLAQDVAAAEQ